MNKKNFSEAMPAATADQDFWLGRAVEARAESAVVEPRHSLRRALGLRALVNHGMTYSTPWRVRDLSMNGAFVEMRSEQLPQGEYVELVLRYRYKDEPVELRLPATVTRVQDDGLGLTFGRYDDQAYTYLANLLYVAK